MLKDEPELEPFLSVEQLWLPEASLNSRRLLSPGLCLAGLLSPAGRGMASVVVCKRAR